MKNNKKEKKNNIMLILGILLIGLIVTIGYAALQANLEINGTAHLGSATWDVYFDNIRLYGTGNVTPTTAPYISDDLTEVSYAVDISNPGDKYEFLVDIVNGGSIDAVLSSHTLSSTNRADVIYTVKQYVGGTAIDISDWHDLDLPKSSTLPVGSNVKTLLVSVSYDRDLADPDTLNSSTTLNLSLDLDYVQG